MISKDQSKTLDTFARRYLTEKIPHPKRLIAAKREATSELKKEVITSSGLLAAEEAFFDDVDRRAYLRELSGALLKQKVHLKERAEFLIKYVLESEEHGVSQIFAQHTEESDSGHVTKAENHMPPTTSTREILDNDEFDSREGDSVAKVKENHIPSTASTREILDNSELHALEGDSVQLTVARDDVEIEENNSKHKDEVNIDKILYEEISDEISDRLSNHNSKESALFGDLALLFEPPPFARSAKILDLFASYNTTSDFAAFVKYNKLSDRELQYLKKCVSRLLR